VNLDNDAEVIKGYSNEKGRTATIPTSRSQSAETDLNESTSHNIRTISSSDKAGATKMQGAIGVIAIWRRLKMRWN